MRWDFFLPNLGLFTPILQSLLSLNSRVLIGLLPEKLKWSSESFRDDSGLFVCSSLICWKQFLNQNKCLQSCFIWRYWVGSQWQQWKPITLLYNNIWSDTDGAGCGGCTSCLKAAGIGSSPLRPTLSNKVVDDEWIYGNRGSQSNRQSLSKSLSWSLESPGMATLGALTQVAVVYQPLCAETKCFKRVCWHSGQPWNNHTRLQKVRHSQQIAAEVMAAAFLFSETRWVSIHTLYRIK